MKYINPKVVLVGLFITLIVLVVGCSSDTQSESEENGTASNTNDQKTQAEEGNEATTLTFLVDNQSVMDGLEAVAAAIEEKFNISTEFEVRPNGAEGVNIIKTRLATDEMTDIMWYNSGSLFEALSPEEHFADLSGEPFMERVDDSFKETVTVEGKVYGIPAYAVSAGGWLYNKKVYEELGLEVPHTWDELMENNEVIKNAGKIPVIASFKDTWTSQMILLADYYNVHREMPDFPEKYTNNEISFSDSPLALRGFEKLQEIHDAGYFNDEENATGFTDALRMLAEGEAAHYVNTTSVLAPIAANHIDYINDIGFFGQPGDDPDNHGMTLWMPNGIYLNKNSEKLEAAKKWMEFYVSEEGLDIYMSQVKADGPYAIKGAKIPEDAYPAVKEMVPYLDEGRVAPALEFLSPLKGPNLEQLTVEVGIGMSTAEEAAQKYYQDVERQAKQLGLEGWD